MNSFKDMKHKISTQQKEKILKIRTKNLTNKFKRIFFKKVNH